MPGEARMTLPQSRLSYRVLGGPPDRMPADRAAQALVAFVERKRAGLAQLIEVQAAEGVLHVTARGEWPEESLAELRTLLGLDDDRAAGEIEVDPGEFAIEVDDVRGTEFAAAERVILHSRVRRFPYPVCEWFDISSGLLTLTESGVAYEPEYSIVDEAGRAGPGGLVVPLDDVRHAFRGEWWDVPCLMLQTAAETHRFGWPAERDDPSLEFQVSEWVDAIRRLMTRRAGE